jgi:AraC family transcriptional regulator
LSSQFYDHIVWTDNQLRGGLNIGRSSIWNICNKIIRELQSPGLASAAYIDALAHILIIELMRLFSGDNSSQRSVGGMPGWRLSRLDERIARVGAPASLQELAALCGLSQRQLMRSFQQARGESLGAYVDRVCLENVKLALAGSTDSISEIADRFGFASLSSLSTTFRNKVGMTPRQYRAHNFQQPNLARI